MCLLHVMAMSVAVKQVYRRATSMKESPDRPVEFRKVCPREDHEM